MKKIKNLIIIIFLLIIYIYTVYLSVIPPNIILLEGEKENIKNIFGIQKIKTAKTINDSSNISNIEFKLFGKINLKSVNITTIDEIEVVPVGKIIGLKLYTNGVLIVGLSKIEDENNNLVKSYNEQDIKEGDTIVKVNDEEIEDIESLKEKINKSNGEKVTLTLVRNGSIVTSSILPIKTKNGNYKLGLWVKDAATGVGTMTFYEPISNYFAALGHGITDSDTENLINIDSGDLVTSRVISIQKGETENPGEIRGTILNQQTIGTVLNNSKFGIYGKLNNLTSLNIDVSKKIKIGLRDEIKVGDAKILCALDNSNVAQEYSIEIEKIYLDNNYNNKSMLLKVTDRKLLEKTGGIIRGLSGAPIIQNGKFIGAITNVLVSNPEVGYGIFADLMIKEMRRY